MPAEGFTKALPAVDYARFVDKCGLREIKELLKRI